jgi:hypothetical protein
MLFLSPTLVIGNRVPTIVIPAKFNAARATRGMPSTFAPAARAPPTRRAPGIPRWHNRPRVTSLQLGALVASSFGAGAMNAMAGGGTILTYPTLLLLGESAIVANATSTIALWPGAAASMWGYRRGSPRTGTGSDPSPSEPDRRGDRFRSAFSNPGRSSSASPRS